MFVCLNHSIVFVSPSSSEICGFQPKSRILRLSSTFLSVPSGLFLFQIIFPLNPTGMLLSSILLLFGFIWKVFKAGSMLLPWSSLETGSLLLQREALLEVLHSFDGVYHSWQADVIHALWFFALMWWWHATAARIVFGAKFRKIFCNAVVEQTKSSFF